MKSLTLLFSNIARLIMLGISVCVIQHGPILFLYGRGFRLAGRFVA